MKEAAVEDEVRRIKEKVFLGILSMDLQLDGVEQLLSTFVGHVLDEHAE